MTGQDCANVGLSLLLQLTCDAQIVPGGDRDLAGVCLVLERVELEVPGLRHDVDAGRARISLRLLPHAAAESVDLLRF